MKINVNGVNITLTKEQLAEINRQVNKQKTVEDIDSYQDACNILGNDSLESPTVEEQLKTIIQAANYLDNGNQVWKADFSNDDCKYIPYFQYSGAGWSVLVVHWLGRCSGCPGWLYFKKESTARLIAEKFEKSLYNKYMG